MENNLSSHQYSSASSQAFEDIFFDSFHEDTEQQFWCSLPISDEQMSQFIPQILRVRTQQRLLGHTRGKAMQSSSMKRKKMKKSQSQINKIQDKRLSHQLEEAREYPQYVLQLGKLVSQFKFKNATRSSQLTARQQSKNQYNNGQMIQDKSDKIFKKARRSIGTSYIQSQQEKISFIKDYDHSKLPDSSENPNSGYGISDRILVEQQKIQPFDQKLKATSLSVSPIRFVGKDSHSRNQTTEYSELPSDSLNLKHKMRKRKLVSIQGPSRKNHKYIQQLSIDQCDQLYKIYTHRNTEDIASAYQKFPIKNSYTHQQLRTYDQGLVIKPHQMSSIDLNTRPQPLHIRNITFSQAPNNHISESSSLERLNSLKPKKSLRNITFKDKQQDYTNQSTLTQDNQKMLQSHNILYQQQNVQPKQQVRSRSTIKSASNRVVKQSFIARNRQSLIKQQ